MAVQTTEQEAQQAAAVAGQVDVTYLTVLMDDRQADRFLQEYLGHLHFKGRKQSAFRAAPMRQHPALCVQHLGIGHFFGGRDQGQCFIGGRLVVEHNGRFHGVIDRAGDQLQVVVGISAQGQDTEQRQRDARHGHRHQRDDQVATTQDRTQCRAIALAGRLHGAADLRRDSCNTLG